MSSDVTIQIFGTVSMANPAAIDALAAEVAEEGTLDWTESILDDEIVDLLVEAAEEGRALLLTRSDTNNLFAGVTSACQDLGLSYVVNVGESGDDGYTSGFSWAPGMESEFHFSLTDDAPALKVSEIRQLLGRGDNALQKRLDELESRTNVGKVVLAPGFVEAYEAQQAETPGI